MHDLSAYTHCENAWAKINLDLRITGRREDGYHLLDSIVVFADCADRLFYRPSSKIELNIGGPFGEVLSTESDNLVLKAIRLLSERTGVDIRGSFFLEKNLPVASGIGGGSADAAAALRLCRDIYDIQLIENEWLDICLKLGADVSVCFLSSSCRMQGIGEILTPVKLPTDLYILLVNPGVSVSTKDIFGQMTIGRESVGELGRTFSPEMDLEKLRTSGNDLQGPACDLVPVIYNVLETIAALDECQMSRMSGSGATCFGMFTSQAAVNQAVGEISDAQKNWWVCSGKLI